MQARNLENAIENTQTGVGGGKDTWEPVSVKEQTVKSVEMDQLLGSA
jgi:hypothetical protein